MQNDHTSELLQLFEESCDLNWGLDINRYACLIFNYYAVMNFQLHIFGDKEMGIRVRESQQCWGLFLIF